MCMSTLRSKASKRRPSTVSTMVARATVSPADSSSARVWLRRAFEKSIFLLLGELYTAAAASDDRDALAGRLVRFAFEVLDHTTHRSHR